MLPVLVSAQEVIDSETLYAGGPAAPTVTSSTYPDSNRWYRSAEGVFSWKIDGDTTAVAVGVSTEAGTEPMKSYRPAIDSITLPASDLVDGVNYVSVQLRNFEKWGKFSEFKVQIDNIPPEAFNLSLEGMEDGTGVVKFNATDNLSGIARYELREGDNPIVTLTPAEVADGYWLHFTSSDPKTINVVAYDQAGNSRESSVLVVPTKIKHVSGGAIGVVADEPASFLVAVMASIMLLMFGYLIYERQRYARSLKTLRRETGEVQEQLIRIFSALREEIYDQIRGITNKKRMTKGEQAAVDGLNKALSVSESLIEKEVKDVKKLLED